MVPTFSFKTITDPAEGFFRERGSKFMAYAFPVSDEATIRTIIEQIQKDHPKARHCCYAWVLGVQEQQHRTFDAGEPNHSAGDPILGQIRSKELTNVLVVVVRYFGGVKLGIGGLVDAYKTAAREALDAATITTKEVTIPITISFPADATADVMRVLNEFQISILDNRFTTQSVLDVAVKLKNKSQVLQRLEGIAYKGISWTEG